jgi:N-acetylmuramoyl-L-alanine amidase
MAEHDVKNVNSVKKVNKVRAHYILSVCIFAITAGLCGCEQPVVNAGANRKFAVAPPGTIRASEMGDRLGLMVQKNSAHSTTLANRSNSVVFFADPGGLAYVNGRAVGPKGGFASVGGTVYVPASIEREIRMLLRAPRRIAPPVRRVIPVRRSLPSAPKPQLKYGPVVIDAGHGGKDPGAGHNGCREKDIALDVALMTVEKLKASGVDARMTRSNDTFIELNDRAALAGKVRAKLFVSLHCDAASNRRARGFTIYAPETRMKQTASLASVMEKSMLSTSMTSRGVRPAGFRVLLRTTCPAVLLEMGYLTNRYDARLLSSKHHQRAVSSAVANAVTRYLTK